jgi:hypothetical protein
VGFSCLLKIEAFEHDRERFLGSFNGFEAEGLDAEKTFGASAALSRGFGETGGDVTFRFEAVECAVKSSHGDGALGAVLNLMADGDAIGVDSEAKDGEQDDLLKLTEEFA